MADRVADGVAGAGPATGTSGPVDDGGEPFARWRVGAITVTRVVEQRRVTPLRGLLPAATDEVLAAHADWLCPDYVVPDRGPADGAPDLRMNIQSFVVTVGGRTVLVDTCVGNDKERTFTRLTHNSPRFLDDLTAAGHPPESIDLVLCTHLHFDHVGWNTVWRDGRWVPTFPAARYLFASGELAFWRQERDRGAASALDRDGTLADSVEPLVDAGLVDTVDPPCEILPGVRLVPTPGHTPGHVSVRLTSEGPAGVSVGVISGDAMHSPVQVADPSVGSTADSDVAVAAVTRRDLLAACEREDAVLFGTHFPTPSAGRVRSRGEGFRLERP